MRIISYLTLLAIICSYPLFGEEKTYEDIYTAGPLECLSYKGYNRFENSLRFKNECVEKLDAYVCIEYFDGKTELRRSRRTIPRRGNWKISADLGREPRGVYWSSDPFEPEIPRPCR